MSVGLEIPAELRRRADATAARIRLLHEHFAIGQLSETEFPDLAMFATGSLGRGELGRASDLDLFLVDVTANGRLSRLSTIRLQAALIEAAAKAGFEPFSGDGKYLEVQHIDDVLREIGTQTDDSSNAFTARMLLLLESQPLLGADAYDRCVEAAVDIYARDARTAGTAFAPQFLINDLVRYWKTLCLNYEAKRHKLHAARADAQRSAEADQRAAQARLDLLKLRYNRLWTCFNGLIFVVAGVEDGRLSREHATRLADLSPVARACDVVERFPAVRADFERALELYDAFLAATGDAQDLTERLTDESFYRPLREAGAIFGDTIGDILTAVSDGTGVKRFLLL